MQMAPPTPPQPTAVNSDDGFNRVHFRIWQIMVTLITVVVTCWFVTLGAIPAILSIMIAKHIIVAVIAAGLHNPRLQNAKHKN